MHYLDEQSSHYIEAARLEGVDIDEELNSEMFKEEVDMVLQHFAPIFEDDDVKDLWNTIMESIDDVLETYRKGSVKIYIAMRPEIDDFVLEFDADFEQNVRVAYRVVKKFFTNFIEAEMVQGYVVEILEEIRPAVKKIEDFAQNFESFMQKHKSVFERRVKRSVDNDMEKLESSIQKFIGSLKDLSRKEVTDYIESKYGEKVEKLGRELMEIFDDIDFETMLIKCPSMQCYDDFVEYIDSSHFKKQLDSLINGGKIGCKHVSEDEFVDIIRHAAVIGYPAIKEELKYELQRFRPRSNRLR